MTEPIQVDGLKKGRKVYTADDGQCYKVHTVQLPGAHAGEVKFRCTAAHCTSAGKAVEHPVGFIIAEPVYLTLTPRSSYTVDLENARLQAVKACADAYRIQTMAMGDDDIVSLADRIAEGEIVITIQPKD